MEEAGGYPSTVHRQLSRLWLHAGRPTLHDAGPLTPAYGAKIEAVRLMPAAPSLHALLFR